MIQTILGKKLGQTQGFLEDGRRIPMTRIDVSGIVVSQIKTKEHEGYDAIQLGYGMNKKADKPTNGHATKAGLTSTPRFFKESKVDKIEEVEVGSSVNVEEILGAGDIVDVSGTSKGKGYAGVVKRHHFKGGPKTHGQSDRHRAPGSIGQSTTPGRVYKGKRMAGHMGVDQKTVKNLEVIDLTDGILLVKGLVPGHISSMVTITKRGVNKKAMGLYKEPVVEEILEDVKVEEVGPSVEEQEALRQAQDEQMKEVKKAEAAEAQVANQSTDAKAVEDKVEAPEVEAEEAASEPAEVEAEVAAEEEVAPEVEETTKEEKS